LLFVQAASDQSPRTLTFSVTGKKELIEGKSRESELWVFFGGTAAAGRIFRAVPARSGVREIWIRNVKAGMPGPLSQRAISSRHYQPAHASRPFAGR